MTRWLAIICAASMLSGCVSTAASIITAPVRAVGQAADWATTSQDERDREVGRRVRERDAQMGRLQRELRRADGRCSDGDDDACDDARQLRDRIDLLRDAPL